MPWIRYLCLCVLSLAVAAGAAVGYLEFSNTLLSNGNWVPGKAISVREPDSAAMQLLLRRALRGRRLNPAFYFGNGRFAYKTALRPESIGFNLWLGIGSWLAVMLTDEDGAAAAAIRLSANPAFANMFFTADRDGKFTAKEPLDIQTLDYGRAIRVNIAFGKDSITASADGRLLGRSASPPPAGKSVCGFACGQEDAGIDKVSIIRTDGPAITDDFDRFELLPTAFALALAIVVPAVLAAAALIRRRRIGREKRLDIIIRGLGATAAAIAAFIALDSFSGPIEPAEIGGPISKARQEKIFLSLKDRPDRMADIYRYNMPLRPKLTLDRIIAQARAALNEKTAPRVLFLGDSQLWGWNTKDINDNMVKRTQSLLAKNGINVLCVNGGLPGRTAAQSADIHARHWAPLGPELCLVNMRNNDIDSFMDNALPTAEDFGRNLARIIKENEKAGTRTALVIEPMQKTFPDAGDRFAAFREQITAQGKKHGCPVWDLNAHIVRARDSGFLWEDSIHLTPYATGLAARFLADRVAEELSANQALVSRK